MYKRTARAFQRRVETLAPKPTGGSFGLSFEHDFIASADNMSMEECLAERSQLLIEKTRAENALIASKAAGDRVAIEALGHRIQAFGSRLGLIKKRMHALSQDTHGQILRDCINDLCPPDLAKAVFDECKRRSREAARDAGRECGVR